MAQRNLVQRPDLSRHQTQQSNPDQSVMVAALMGKEITVDIPPSAQLSEVESTLEIAISGYQRLQSAQERLKPIIGRILLVISDRKLFRPQYKNFTDFLMARVVNDMGFGRSNAFDALRIARAFPTMSVDDYQNYGATRLLHAAQVVSEQSPDYRKVLDESTRTTVDEFKAHVKEIRAGLRAISSPQSTNTAVISLRTSNESKQRFLSIVQSLDMPSGQVLDKLMDAYDAQSRGSRAPQRAMRAG